ncbi:hypothetical protein UP09_07260 [Bradyrhizobium sp. LTSP885]|uniref:DUF5681 domain-containing protein n=1 Tax=Bradyrhizobium sp. LTSP885 TaxID=1619232 RepID=UPI0005C98CB7|nr:DUF5681 domain-containing protein [Bradyrhizobium sp. LTSP885]KJC49487.1 hypothetical protein UP09_07260 [Bradyrhizobium sp. LTSP885]
MIFLDNPSEEEKRENPDKVGYRKPPKSTQFAKGRSGNPAGRPRGRHRSAPPYETVLGQMVTIREGGRERRAPAEQAFLLQLAKRGLEGDGVAARTSLALIEQARNRQRPAGPIQFVLVAVAPGGVTCALQALRMATKLDPLRKTARMALETWIVEAALARLPHPLTPDAQRVVVAATRTPQKVRWPEWWSCYP